MAKKLMLENYILQKGRCYLCGEATKDPEAFLHFQCAISYDDYKRKLLKEQDEKSGQ